MVNKSQVVLIDRRSDRLVQVERFPFAITMILTCGLTTGWFKPCRLNAGPTATRTA